MVGRRFVLQWLVIAVVATAGGAGIYYSPGNRFMRKYRSLEVGMSEQQVEQLFGKPAEYACEYRRLRIEYYRRPMIPGQSLEIDDPLLPQGVVVAEASELPYIYAAAQVALDEDNRVVAYTLNGETTEIVTSKGRFPGSHFRRLPTGVLGDLQVHGDN